MTSFIALLISKGPVTNQNQVSKKIEGKLDAQQFGSWEKHVERENLNQRKWLACVINNCPNIRFLLVITDKKIGCYLWDTQWVFRSIITQFTDLSVIWFFILQVKQLYLDQFLCSRTKEQQNYTKSRIITFNI